MLQQWCGPAQVGGLCDLPPAGIRVSVDRTGGLRAVQTGRALEVEGWVELLNGCAMFAFWYWVFTVASGTTVLAFESEIVESFCFPPDFDTHPTLPSVPLALSKEDIANLVQDKGLHLPVFYKEVGKGGFVGNPSIGVVQKRNDQLMNSVGE